MSSLSKCLVFQVEDIRDHPNGDALEVVQVFGFPSIVRKGLHKPGDLAVFIPPDMVVPDKPEYAFLKDNKRIRGIKLRGLFSAGLVMHAPPNSKIGDDVTEIMGVTRYQISEQMLKEGFIDGPVGCPKYTDIESFRRYHHVLIPDEPVIIQEKLDGVNVRYYFDGLKLHVGTHQQWVKEDTNVYWNAANDYKIMEKLQFSDKYIISGEIVGIQKLKYGHSRIEPGFYGFDIFNIETGKYIDRPGDMFAVLGIPTTPTLYIGPYLGYEKTAAYAEGPTCISASVNHVREGFVIRPETERYNEEIGRVILKTHGEGYLIQKI